MQLLCDSTLRFYFAFLIYVSYLRYLFRVSSLRFLFCISSLCFLFRVSSLRFLFCISSLCFLFRISSLCFLFRVSSLCFLFRVSSLHSLRHSPDNCQLFISYSITAAEGRLSNLRFFNDCNCFTFCFFLLAHNVLHMIDRVCLLTYNVLLLTHIHLVYICIT